MAMYDDILKQMQTSFAQSNPKMFGKPGGFSNQSFNFNPNSSDPDVIKPGGGFGTGGTGPTGGTGGTEGNVPIGTQTSTNNQSTQGGTSYGGGFNSQFSSLDTLLGDLGQGGFNFYDPGSQYGFGAGSGYEDYFQSFDTVGYTSAMDALEALEKRKMGSIGQQYEYKTQDLQGELGKALSDMLGKESITGLQSGRGQERRRMTREVGDEQFSNLGRQTQDMFGQVQQEIGQGIGQLEGTLMDYLSRQSNVALSLEQSDAKKQEAGSEATNHYSNQPRGNALDASTLSQYNIFGDLTNSQQAWAAFQQAAHSNLNQSQLNNLMNDIYAQYQNEEESGDG